MTDPHPTGPDQGGSLPFLGRYLAVLMLVIIAMLAAGWVLARYGIPLPPGAAAIFPPIVAALHCGQHWGRAQGRVPDGSRAWRWAFVAALVYLALMLVLVMPFAGPLLATVGPLIVLLIGGTTLMSLLLNRFFLVIGARSGVAQSKRG